MKRKKSLLAAAVLCSLLAGSSIASAATLNFYGDVNLGYEQQTGGQGVYKYGSDVIDRIDITAPGTGSVANIVIDTNAQPINSIADSTESKPKLNWVEIDSDHSNAINISGGALNFNYVENRVIAGNLFTTYGAFHTELDTDVNTKTWISASGNDPTLPVKAITSGRSVSNTLNFNDRLYVDMSWVGNETYIIDNGHLSTLNINTKDFKLSNGTISNAGTLRVNPDNLAGTQYINGKLSCNITTSTFSDVWHSNTAINLKGDDPTGKFNAVLYGAITANDNFRLNLDKQAMWIVHEGGNYGGNYIVPNVSLKNGGAICLGEHFPIDQVSPTIAINDNDSFGINGSLRTSSLPWPDDYLYKILRLKNFNNDGTGRIIVETDLAHNIGEMVEFSGTTPSNTLNMVILNKDNNSGVPIYESDGHKVTIAHTPEGSNMNIAATGYFYAPNQTSNNLELFTPIIRTESGISPNGNPGTNWNFVGWGTQPMPPDPLPPGPDPVPPPSENPLESVESITRNEANINTRDIDTTVKRLNDIRTDPAEVGVWVKGERGKNKIRSYSYDYSVMSGGYDWHIDNDARSLFYGIGVTYSKNNCDDGVVGESKSTGVNLFGSWLGKKNNDYVDLVLKYGKLKKDYSGTDVYGADVYGEYDKDLFVISTKYGRRFYNDKGFYIEPQLGYSYGHVGSADYEHKQRDPNGVPIPVHADATNSHIVSFDLQVGQNVKGTEMYTKLGYVYDLDGKITVSSPMLPKPEKDDMGGGYVRWTMGAARKVGKHNSFYMELEKDFGSKVKKPYAVSLGYRHTF